MCGFFFTCCIMGLNLTLQFAILFWIKQYVMDPSMRQAQDTYGKFHREVFDNSGTFSQANFEQFGSGDKEALCQMTLSKHGFIFAILFLWGVTCITEVRDLQRTIQNFWALPDLPEGEPASEMVNEVGTKREDDDVQEVHELICLSQNARRTLNVLIFVPKLVIVVVLTYVGCVWLTATQSFADLILNALALEFVIQIDEALYEYFFPKANREAIGLMQLAIEVKEDEDADPDNAILASYARSVVYIGGLLIFVELYLNYLQPVLPNFMHDIAEVCVPYLEETFVPHCAPFSSGCFQFGKATQ
mmetsp:Transcript_27008/g.57503  ORF Transcript_27008/g.57503 Transcript_27008/m.57503 type:complete len:303 (+) Transcript_27008:252-1160(+)